MLKICKSVSISKCDLFKWKDDRETISWRHLWWDLLRAHDKMRCQILWNLTLAAPKRCKLTAFCGVSLLCIIYCSGYAVDFFGDRLLLPNSTRDHDLSCVVFKQMESFNHLQKLLQSPSRSFSESLLICQTDLFLSRDEIESKWVDDVVFSSSSSPPQNSCPVLDYYIECNYIHRVG